ncbi:MAG: hypothetical protein CMI08_17755 [Oceanospirillaceae bacterium]|uniref:hypothetical protein n=1 Tax=unclassified Thalassolituus TaxID=2624967 RepID=UPI000C3B152F|nr:MULTISPECIES: hypothetical protein [unclassified Thalassolituus]MAS26546.1 hypothetical protein [Oceanospirillaceae bacterium]MAY01012.1 hypothetical protein [Oceanospirillaceae bacterium]MBL34629.1 hypothetical protein [Oceanospirillaceae bacterium]MBS52501.1 hypothetical protein [Oceanospirillaceae bacterium]|tara:strand:- start:67 stop:1470 length:1404 start_codon:yes stop_codon:yes gene_type:complete
MVKNISAACVAITIVFTLYHRFFGELAGLVVATSSLVVFLFLQWPKINNAGRILMGVAGVSLLFLGLSSDPLATLESALSRAIYFATFLLALAFLRVAAVHSHIVRQCGQLVVHQPPLRRYGIISFASYLFGTIINFGVVHLLGEMVARGNTLQSAGGLEHVQAIRRRRMNLAIMRGFSLVPLASPFSITMAVMLATIPGLDWFSLLPLGLLTAGLLLLLGWFLDYTTNPRQAPPSAQYSGPQLSWLPAVKFLLIVISFFSLAVLIERSTSANLPLSIVVASPVIGLAWLLLENPAGRSRKALTSSLQILRQQFPVEATATRSEIAILGAASIFGVIMAELLPHDVIVDSVNFLQLSGWILALVAGSVIILLAQFGINPIASAAIIAAALTPAESFGLQPQVLALGLMAGWSLAMNSSPVMITALLISSTTGTNPREITYRWNLLYNCVAFVVLAVWVFALDYILRT